MEDLAKCLAAKLFLGFMWQAYVNYIVYQLLSAYPCLAAQVPSISLTPEEMIYVGDKLARIMVALDNKLANAQVVG
jgi:hypothetical protein